MKLRILFLLLLLAACSPLPAATGGPDEPVSAPAGDDMSTNEPSRNPFLPQAGDDGMTRGKVYLDEARLVVRESFPPQVSLSLRGNLPTPCNQLRVAIGEPDKDKNIQVEIYSITDPNRACAQVLKPFEESIELGSLASGHYTVWVNGDIIGEIDT